VDELWDSMCQSAMGLISKALDEVDNAEVLLKIKGVIALFIQTMDVSRLILMIMAQLTFFIGLGLLSGCSGCIFTEAL
jgi:hypothetical protein